MSFVSQAPRNAEEADRQKRSKELRDERFGASFVCTVLSKDLDGLQRLQASLRRSIVVFRSLSLVLLQAALWGPAFLAILLWKDPAWPSRVGLSKAFAVLALTFFTVLVLSVAAGFAARSRVLQGRLQSLEWAPERMLERLAPSIIDSLPQHFRKIRRPLTICEARLLAIEPERWLYPL